MIVNIYLIARKSLMFDRNTLSLRVFELLSLSFVRFNPDCRRVTIQENLTFVPGYGIRTDDPRGFNKGRCSKFRVGSRFRQTREEGQRIYRPKRKENNNKDGDNSPKILNGKNHQVSSQKFRQLIRISKVGNCSRGWPEGCIFNNYYTEV